MMKKNNLSIVVVTFNNSGTIGDCIDSVLKYSPGAEIILIDNNSSDDTCKTVGHYGNKVILLKSSDNLGFAKANNLGASRATSAYLVFLNPDTKLRQQEGLEKLKQILEENPDYGIIGPQLISPNGQVQKSVRKLPTIPGAFKEYILNIKDAYDFYLPDCQTFCEVESVIGACMVIKKKIFIDTGGFNEKYFVYFEDLELCKSVRKMGLKIGFLPEVKIEHVKGASGKNLITYQLLHDSAKKYHGIFAYYLIQFIIRLGRLLHV